MKNSHTLGKHIRRVRIDLGFSIRRLAAAAGVDASWLSRLERGDYNSPDPRCLSQLAAVLEIDPIDLYLLAGYPGSERLPGFAPYLRAKYDLPPEAVTQLEAHFRLLNEKYRREKGGEGDVERDHDTT